MFYPGIHEVGLGSVLDKHADVVFKQKQMELFKRVRIEVQLISFSILTQIIVHCPSER